jgi:uncharacterized RDD family membrane protein YckC
MKCESCGNELIGAAIICRACNHNNALYMRIAQRRADLRLNQSTRSRANGPLAGLPTIVPRKDADVKLLHFPSALNKHAAPARQTVAESEPEAPTYPPWRAELKERVRQIKEKRAASELIEPKPSPVHLSRGGVGEAKLNRNPIVESALNRIRLASRATERRRDGETERQRDGETERQRDGETERRRDRERESPSVPPSLRPSVSLSPCPSVATSPLPSVTPSLHQSVTRQVSNTGGTTTASPKTSTGKPSNSGPPASAPVKHSETRIIEIAQAIEQPRPDIEPAALVARILAGVCDFEIVFTAFLLIFGGYATSNNATLFDVESRLLMASLLLAVVFIYQIVMLVFAGRTFGMALLKLNLVNTDDESMPVTLWQKILRASAATIVFICFPLYLTAWLSASRRTLPDLISGTTVRGSRIED